jgi:tRNA1Val (adenine37-N6)-methyltransferase
MRDKSVFRFKQFNISHRKATMKVGTDGVLLGAWINLENATRILDVGTGTGVIALMLAQRTQPHVCINAIDISEEDCEVARENVSQSPWPDKVVVQHTALQQFVSEPFDLIVSNPPYFINSFKPLAEKRMQARHTETLSQIDLLHHSKRLLSPAGRLSVILPETEAQQLITLSSTQGWFCNRQCAFRARTTKPVERLLMEFSFHPKPEIMEDLVLYKTGNDWSDGYRALTRDFYLKL